MIISAIAAMSRNRVVGRDGSIPWHLPRDLKYFKRTTLNHHILMGRKTFASMGKPLPRRTNIILTRNPNFDVPNARVVHNLDEGIRIAYENGEQELFVIGGGEIYKMALPLMNRIYLTVVDTIIANGDAFFPVFERDKWRLVFEESDSADENHAYDFTFKVYERIGSTEWAPGKST